MEMTGLTSDTTSTTRLIFSLVSGRRVVQLPSIDFGSTRVVLVPTETQERKRVPSSFRVTQKIIVRSFSDAEPDLFVTTQNTTAEKLQ